ncbi:S-adenosyl-L-methionine-dependent methyltransferase [Thozetella sp. PMI_491]|nr:S-adenosyl-L-methionine-dependent methyltransferase [Thozetella sp. PMI_491]
MADADKGQGHTVDSSIATSPNNLDGVAGLVQDINSGVKGLEGGGTLARQDLLLKARALVQALETPRETMVKHTWAQTGVAAAISLGVDTGLWSLMAKEGDKPQKTADLASSLKIDPVLLARLLKHLAAMGYINETGPDEYKPTNFSKALSLPIIGDGYIVMLGGLGAAPLQFHEFARKRQWINPTDSGDTALKFAYHMDMDTFAWVHSLGYGMRFGNHMGGYRQGRLPWVAPKLYPVQQRLIDGADTGPDTPFLVDIGGSIGHDLVEFRTYHPNHPGKLVLQDLPAVIDQIADLDPAIERMKYDFFTEQPLKGARAYYLHSVLHDWPDDKARSILANIKKAMKPGYSRLLINENVIPQTDAYWETTALDMVMLTNFSAKERTEGDWQELIASAGLKLFKIWNGGKGVESVIECELP